MKKVSELLPNDFIEIPGNLFSVPKRGLLSCTVKSIERLPPGHYKVHTVSAGTTKALNPEAVFKPATTHLVNESFSLSHSRGKTYNGLGID